MMRSQAGEMLCPQSDVYFMEVAAEETATLKKFADDTKEAKVVDKGQICREFF